MKEDFVDYIWRFKKFDLFQLRTHEDECLKIISFGFPNHNAGPDYFNSKIEIGNQVWVGNIELHVNSSDWFKHAHNKDVRYDNVILHVVWNNDKDVFRKDGSKIPVLELKNYTSFEIVDSYNQFINKKTKFIICENQILSTSSFKFDSFKERLFIERIEGKIEFINKGISNENIDWEALLFNSLLTNFGLKINKNSFQSIANSLDFELWRKVFQSPFQLEALLFGQSKLLPNSTDEYSVSLNNEYQYLKSKYNIENVFVETPLFHRLRPISFPTIRLSQFSSLYSKNQSLFSKILQCSTLEEYYNLFSVSTSEYWRTHYNFGKESKYIEKKVSSSFINLLLINTVLPLKFLYMKNMGQSFQGDLLKMASKVKSENNSIIDAFSRIGLKSKSAFDSQALIHLFNNYCEPKKCLSCVVGNELLS